MQLQEFAEKVEQLCVEIIRAGKKGGMNGNDLANIDKLREAAANIANEWTDVEMISALNESAK